MGMFELIAMLSSNKVNYVLVGGLAVALQGYQRVTMDVDIVLAMDDDNLVNFIKLANVAGLRPAIPVPIDSLRQSELIEQWHREKGMIAFSLRTSDAVALVIDVLVRPKVPYAELCRDAVNVEVGEHSIPVASIDHLIALKTGSGRSKDMIDIEALQRIKAGEKP